VNTPLSATAASLRRLSAWIDGSYDPGMVKELVLRRRVGKLMEEVGEVGTALGGVTGENPRKGVTHTESQLMDELLDVAITALGAWEHMDGNQGRSVHALSVALDRILNRAGLGAEPGHMIRSYTLPAHLGGTQ
jgi:NTP pyrophosphatase (non-canonical NTP hydrolase)